ncbi:MAG: NAD(P) transhydrogenase subunit alpha [Actinomycetota bacterium]
MQHEGVTVGVPRETFPGETRVAMIPLLVPVLAKVGLEVVMESGAGAAAGHLDEAYASRGARVASREEVLAADVLLQVRTLGANPDAGRADLDALRSGQVLIGLGEPLAAAGSLAELAHRGLVVFAMELIPRIARAQSMDVLSSQSTVSGYKAVILAAERLPKLFPMLTTAAGTVAPARVFVIGAGVAGLQAIATARRLGALVEAYDVRAAAQEDVESLGARLVPLPQQPGEVEDANGYATALGEDFTRRQQEHLTEVVAGVDVVITTAAVPGGRAPVLLTEAGVEAMGFGSVVVDLAAARGGNCALTRADEEVVAHDVTILGPTNLPATVPFHASQLYARNLVNFLLHLMPEGRWEPAWEDEIVGSTLVARDGDIVHPQVRRALEGANA